MSEHRSMLIEVFLVAESLELTFELHEATQQLGYCQIRSSNRFYLPATYLYRQCVDDILGSFSFMSPAEHTIAVYHIVTATYSVISIFLSSIP